MAGLFDGARKLPGLFADFFEGSDNPQLSAQQNAEAAKQARLQAGLQMMLASRSGAGQPAPGLMQLMAAGALTGQAAGGQARGGMVQAQALQNPALGLDPRTRAIMSALPPQLQQELLGKMALQGGGDPVALAPGHELRTPSGQLLATNQAQAAKPLDFPIEWDAALLEAGINPLTFDIASADPQLRDALGKRAREIANERRPQTTINLAEGARSQAVSTLYQNAVADMASSEDLIGRLDVIDQLIEQGLQTGKVQDITMPLRQIGAEFGLADADQLGQQELYQGLTKRVALLLRGTSMPGPMSDKDIQFLVDQAPALGRSRYGNALLSQLLRRVAQRQIDQAVEIDRFMAENPDGVGYLAHRARWQQQNRIDLSDLVEQARGIVAQQAPF